MKRQIRNAGRPITGFIFLLGLILTAAWPMASTDTDKGSYGDAEITHAVEMEFWAQEGVNPYWMDIATVDGVVTLSGKVDNLLAKERASTIAAGVKGVRSVVNRLEISPSNRADVAILRDIEDALADDPAADGHEVAVAVLGGVARLSGMVDSWAERRLVETVAKGVRGVTGVENHLKVVYKSERADSEIKAEIAERLRWDIRVDDGLIDVAVADGEVTLTGAVGSLAEKRRAYFDSWLAGVASVDDSGLEVKFWARDDRLREGKYVVKRDSAVRDAILAAFQNDPRVWSFNPDVQVQNGVVTLRGVVDNAKARQAAEQDARNTVGVWRVRNHLKVRPDQLPVDSVLVERVARALDRSPFVDRDQILIRAERGVVTLSGTVETDFERSRAYEAATGVTGVIDVNDRMLVEKALNRKTDWEIEQDIEDQLFWSPFVDSDEVEVEVRDGIARLSGTVDTLQESRDAEVNALEGGAVAVDNDLKVEFGPVRYSP